MGSDILICVSPLYTTQCVTTRVHVWMWMLILMLTVAEQRDPPKFCLPTWNRNRCHLSAPSTTIFSLSNTCLHGYLVRLWQQGQNNSWSNRSPTNAGHLGLKTWLSSTDDDNLQATRLITCICTCLSLRDSTRLLHAATFRFHLPWKKILHHTKSVGLTFESYLFEYLYFIWRCLAQCVYSYLAIM